MDVDRELDKEFPALTTGGPLGYSGTIHPQVRKPDSITCNWPARHERP